MLDEARLNENPVDRLSRRIKNSFWDGLTRRIDSSVIEKIGLDPKDWTDDPHPRIYVPRAVPEQYEYYKKVAAKLNQGPHLSSTAERNLLKYCGVAQSTH